MIHNHPRMEKENLIDEDHVIVDKADFEEALKVQDRIDSLQKRADELEGVIDDMTKLVETLKRIVSSE